MNNQPIPCRVVLVDDHEMVRLGLRALFDGYSHIEVIGEAGTIAEAVRTVEATKPDIVLLDVRLPDGSGLDACPAIRKASPDTKILILTSFLDDRMIDQAIKAGAEGYLLKEIDGPGLVRSLEEILEGQSVLAPAVTRHVMERMRQGDKPGSTVHKLNLLSPQERRVIALVAEGLTNKEIGLRLGLSDKTVKNYLSNLMEKLGISRRSEAAALYVRHSPALADHQ